MESSLLDKYGKILTWILLIILGYSIFFPYLKTEFLTFFYLKEFNLNEVCGQNKISGFKFAKVVEYDKLKQVGIIYCFYDNPEDTKQVKLTFNQSWRIRENKKLNSENGFYWPIYF